jgi:hypothetical protein
VNTPIPTVDGDDQKAPMFDAVEWVPTEKRRGPYSLLSDIRDIASGTGVVLEMVYRNQINAKLDDPPLMQAFHEDQLMRMAIASMNLITRRIDRQFDHMNDPERNGNGEFEYSQSRRTNQESK